MSKNCNFFPNAPRAFFHFFWNWKKKLKNKLKNNERNLKSRFQLGKLPRDSLRNFSDTAWLLVIFSHLFDFFFKIFPYSVIFFATSLRKSFFSPYFFFSENTSTFFIKFFLFFHVQWSKSAEKKIFELTLLHFSRTRLKEKSKECAKNKLTI